MSKPTSLANIFSKKRVPRESIFSEEVEGNGQLLGLKISEVSTSKSVELKNDTVETFAFSFVTDSDSKKDDTCDLTSKDQPTKKKRKKKRKKSNLEESMSCMHIDEETLKPLKISSVLPLPPNTEIRDAIIKTSFQQSIYPVDSNPTPSLALESWKDPTLTDASRQKLKYGSGVRNISAIGRRKVVGSDSMTKTLETSVFSFGFNIFDHK